MHTIQAYTHLGARAHTHTDTHTSTLTDTYANTYLRSPVSCLSMDTKLPLYLSQIPFNFLLLFFFIPLLPTSNQELNLSASPHLLLQSHSHGSGTDLDGHSDFLCPTSFPLIIHTLTEPTENSHGTAGTKGNMVTSHKCEFGLLCKNPIFRSLSRRYMSTNQNDLL